MRPLIPAAPAASQPISVEDLERFLIEQARVSGHPSAPARAQQQQPPPLTAPTAPMTFEPWGLWGPASSSAPSGGPVAEPSGWGLAPRQVQPPPGMTHFSLDLERSFDFAVPQSQISGQHLHHQQQQQQQHQYQPHMLPPLQQHYQLPQQHQQLQQPQHPQQPQQLQQQQYGSGSPSSMSPPFRSSPGSSAATARLPPLAHHQQSPPLVSASLSGSFTYPGFADAPNSMLPSLAHTSSNALPPLTRSVTGVTSPTLPPTMASPRLVPSPLTPLAQPAATDATPLRLASASKQAASRFEWRPVGTMEVHPSVTGPDMMIDLTWEIPARFVSKASLNSRRQSTVNGRDDTTQGDWIGLYRARQRIDVVDGYVLTREVAGRMSLDSRSGMAVGKVRLRTPRGVGMYDFRYFRASDPQSGSDEVVLPLARSGAVVVEVQGGALFEAIEFIEKNMRDRKRLSSVCQQLGTLLHQVKSLRHPLLASMANPKRPVLELAQEQERKLMSDIWRVISECVEKGVEDDVASGRQALIAKEEIALAKAEFEQAAAAAVGIAESAAEHLVDDEEGHQQQESAPASTAAETDPLLVAKQEKRAKLVALQREQAQKDRDASALASGVITVIDEVVNNSCLQALLAPQQRAWLAGYSMRYCPLDERFMASLPDLKQHAMEDHCLGTWKDDGGAVALSDQRAAGLWGALNAFVPLLMPGEGFFQARREVINRLQRILEESGFAGEYGQAPRLIPFGSSANSCGGPKSDLDLCLVMQGAADGTQVIEWISSRLIESGFENVDDTRKTARIPIVQFRDPASGVDCDICINNTLAIRNTRLLKAYVDMDPRVAIMIFFVKHWAKQRRLNDPSNHTLSSYAWVLLIIAFLQRKGVVPVLQMMNTQGVQVDSPENLPSAPDGRIHETYFFGDADSPHFAGERLVWAKRHLETLCARNRTPAVHLLAGFFWDVSFGLDCRRFVTSVRTGALVPKHVKAAEDSWRLHPRCCVEDPFEVSYDVAHVLRDSTFRTIRMEAARAYALMTGIYKGPEVPDVSALDPAQCLEEMCREMPAPAKPSSSSSSNEAAAPAVL